MKIDTKNLKVADVRYYDAKHNGLELTGALSRVVLYNRGDTYVNLLNPVDFAPIYKRARGTVANDLGNGEYIGTKIVRVTGHGESGEAWLLTDLDFSNHFGSSTVDMTDIENFVLNSPDFYKDRIDLIQRRLNEGRAPLRLRTRLIGILADDMEAHDAMVAFFEERKPNKVMQK